MKTTLCHTIAVTAVLNIKRGRREGGSISVTFCNDGVTHQRCANSVLETEYEYEYYSASKNYRIRIRILFGFPKMTEYEYEYYSAAQKGPNTNTNIIRLHQKGQNTNIIRIPKNT